MRARANGWSILPFFPSPFSHTSHFSHASHLSHSEVNVEEAVYEDEHGQIQTRVVGRQGCLPIPLVGMGLQDIGYTATNLHSYIGVLGGKWKGDYGLLTTGLRGWRRKAFFPNGNLRSDPFLVSPALL
jgi:hypothetical protein